MRTTVQIRNLFRIGIHPSGGHLGGPGGVLAPLGQHSSAAGVPVGVPGPRIRRLALLPAAKVTRDKAMLQIIVIKRNTIETSRILYECCFIILYTTETVY